MLSVVSRCVPDSLLVASPMGIGADVAPARSGAYEFDTVIRDGATDDVSPWSPGGRTRPPDVGGAA